MSDPIEPFDRAARRRARDRAAADFARFAFLKDALAADLAERLAELGSSFPRVLDLGSHDGRLAALLPESEMVAADAGFRFAKTARGVMCDVSPPCVTELLFQHEFYWSAGRRESRPRPCSPCSPFSAGVADPA